MRLTYDPKHNIAYIRLRERTEAIETIRLSDEINIDLAADGTVYGIELLDANNQLKASDCGHLVLVDPTGTERTPPLGDRSAGPPALSTARRVRTGIARRVHSTTLPISNPTVNISRRRITRRSKAIPAAVIVESVGKSRGKAARGRMAGRTQGKRRTVVRLDSPPAAPDSPKNFKRIAV